MRKKNKKQRRNTLVRRTPELSGLVLCLGEKIKGYMAEFDEDSLEIYVEMLKMSILSSQSFIESSMALYGSYNSTLAITAAPEPNQVSVRCNGLVRNIDDETYLAVFVDLQQEGVVGGYPVRAGSEKTGCRCIRARWKVWGSNTVRPRRLISTLRLWVSTFGVGSDS